MGGGFCFFRSLVSKAVSFSRKEKERNTIFIVKKMQSPKTEEEEERGRKKWPCMKAAQLQEFRMQALVYRYIEAGLRVPHHLVVPIWNSLALSSSSTSSYLIHYNHHSSSRKYFEILGLCLVKLLKHVTGFLRFELQELQDSCTQLSLAISDSIRVYLLLLIVDSCFELQD